jgi:endonuclease III
MYQCKKGMPKRNELVEKFMCRNTDREFINSQKNILEALSVSLQEYCASLNEHEKPIRIGWASWVKADAGSLFHIFQITALLLFTNSVGDQVVKESIGELFNLESTCILGAFFDNPFTFARDPTGAYEFLTARSCDNAENASKSTISKGISRGFNYGNMKARHLILLSKQLIVYKYVELWEKDIADFSGMLVHGSLDPLPEFILEAVPTTTPLFPPTYDEYFLNRLHGVGPKMRYLIAEAGYNVVKGPAVDCHMIRYTCCLGSGCPLLLGGGSESFANALMSIYSVEDYTRLNEVPASIAQLLRKRQHGILSKALERVALQLGMHDEIRSFLNHYPPQTH